MQSVSLQHRHCLHSGKDLIMEDTLKKASLLMIVVFLAAITGCTGNPQSDEQILSPTTEQQMGATSEITPTATATATAMPPTQVPTATEIPVRVVTVTTEQDVVDGDTGQIDTLLMNPGADGMVSLREAIEAANLTAGAKRIVFSPELKGKTIYLGKAARYEEPRLLLTMDQLTLNGDTDGDGVSDIILDGSALNANYSSAFIINASEINIENLQFNGFQKFAIAIACVNDECAERPYEHIEMRNNTIVSDVGGGGILLVPLKIVSNMSDPTLFSHISISDIQVVDNQIAVRNGGNGGIFIMAAGAGGSDNHLQNILIDGNTISSPGVTITINGGDGSSYYFRLPGEEIFSDRNVVENVTITSNQLDPQGVGGDSARPSGMVIIAGNFGNSDNIIRHMVIENNEVSNHAEHMVTINPTNNDVLGGLPLTTRAATGNVIEDVEIAGNISHADSSAFTLLASSGQDPAPKGATGRISNIRIHDNQILDYKWEGIDMFAGVGESDNLIEDVAIENNTFTALDITKGQSLFIYAGGCSGCKRASERNKITGLVIRGNTINCNDFIFMFGGMEDYASDNTVEYYLGENTLNPQNATVDIADFVAKQNSGNQVTALTQSP